MVPDPLRVTGALVVDGDGRIFFQRRSPTRKLFPNSWDIVGGHLEPGETVAVPLAGPGRAGRAGGERRTR
jgi:8-oxo-dGTP diphosphatase